MKQPVAFLQLLIGKIIFPYLLILFSIVVGTDTIVRLEMNVEWLIGTVR